MNTDAQHILILIVGTVITVILLSWLLRRLLSFFINKNSEAVGANPTAFIFLKNSISFVLVSIGLLWIFYNIPYFNNLGSTLFAGAGILAAIIGFASQKAFANVIGGVFILIFKPFRVGELIQVGGRTGTVEEITLRHVMIRDFEARRIIIPNSTISDETIINSSILDEKIRKHMEFSISYESDVDLAMKLLQEEALNHPACIDNRTDEQKAENSEIVPVKLIRMNDSSLTLRAWVWTESADKAFSLACDMHVSVLKRFKENGIKIPYPQLEVHQAES